MTDNDLIDGPRPGRLYSPSPSWLEFNAASIGLLVMLAAFALGCTNLGKAAWDALTSTKANAAPIDEPYRGAVLVVGTNLKSQTAILLTASPRGYQSVFVSTGDEAISRLRGGSSLFNVAVVDRSAPGGARALDAIARLLPHNRIIALHGPLPSSNLAQLLLDVL